MNTPLPKQLFEKIMRRITYALLSIVFILATLQSLGFFRPEKSEISYGWLFFKGIIVIVIILLPLLVFEKRGIPVFNSIGFSIITAAIIFEYIGTSYGIYRNQWWYDIIAHTGSGVIAFYFLDQILRAYLQISKIDIPANFRYFVALMTSGSIAVFNEILELFVDLVLKDPYERIYPGYDTAIDVTTHAIGSIACLALFILLKPKKSKSKNPAQT